MRSLFSILTLLGCLAIGSSAEAAFKLRVTSSGGGTVDITDGGLGDSSLATGQIGYSNFAFDGTWSVVINVANSKPFVGPDELESHIIVTSTTGGSITIEVTDTDFSVTPGLSGLVSAISGGTGGTLSAEAIKDWDGTATGDREFAGRLRTAPVPSSTDPPTEIVALHSAFTGGAFANTLKLTGSAVGDFSLTSRIVVSHTGAGTSSADHFISPLPEPSSIVLFCSILPVLGAAGFRRWRRTGNA